MPLLWLGLLSVCDCVCVCVVKNSRNKEKRGEKRKSIKGLKQQFNDSSSEQKKSTPLHRAKVGIKYVILQNLMFHLERQEEKRKIKRESVVEQQLKITMCMSTFSNSEQQWSLLALLHKLRSGESASFEVGIQCSDSSGSSRNSKDTEQSQADGWLLICRHLQSQREDKERGSFAKNNRTRRDALFLPSKLTKRKKSLKQTGHRAAVSRHSVFFPHSFFLFPLLIRATLCEPLRSANHESNLSRAEAESERYDGNLK